MKDASSSSNGPASTPSPACAWTRFRHGRVLFAGDSAHGVSPFGARGANSGVQDAENLAWKLAAVLQRQAPDALLDSYADEREYAADENIRNSTRATDFITPKSEISRLFRDAVLRPGQDARLRPHAGQQRAAVGAGDAARLAAEHAGCRRLRRPHGARRGGRRCAGACRPTAAAAGCCASCGTGFTRAGVRRRRERERWRGRCAGRRRPARAAEGAARSLRAHDATPAPAPERPRRPASPQRYDLRARHASTCCAPTSTCARAGASADAPTQLTAALQRALCHRLSRRRPPWNLDHRRPTSMRPTISTRR